MRELVAIHTNSYTFFLHWPHPKWVGHLKYWVDFFPPNWDLNPGHCACKPSVLHLTTTSLHYVYISFLHEFNRLILSTYIMTCNYLTKHPKHLSYLFQNVHASVLFPIIEIGIFPFSFHLQQQYKENIISSDL